MAIFGKKEDKQQKQEEKTQKYLSMRGLGGVSTDILPAIRQISMELAGTDAMQIGGMLTGMKDEDTLKVSYLNALVEQNWIIIKQLDNISKK